MQPPQLLVHVAWHHQTRDLGHITRGKVYTYLSTEHIFVYPAPWLVLVEVPALLLRSLLSEDLTSKAAQMLSHWAVEEV